MQPEDMIFISVDDHLVEPPHLFEGRMPARFAEHAPQVVRHRRRRRRVGLRRRDHPQHRAQRGGRPAQGGVRGQPDRLRRDAPGLLRRARASEGHERRWRARRRCASRRSPSFAGGSFLAADDKELALASVQAYNDWHIDEWCGAYPGRFIPMALPVLWDPELLRDGDPARRGQGLPLGHLHGEPEHARPAELPRRVTGTRCGGRCARPARSCPSTSARRASSR